MDISTFIKYFLALNPRPSEEQVYCLKFSLGISDFENISNYSDFRKIIEDKISELENSKDDKEKELAKRARAIWEEKYDKKSGRGGGTDVYVERYSDALRLIGKTEEEIEKAVQKFVNIGILTVKSESLSSEREIPACSAPIISAKFMFV